MSNELSKNETKYNFHEPLSSSLFAIQKNESMNAKKETSLSEELDHFQKHTKVCTKLTL